MSSHFQPRGPLTACAPLAHSPATALLRSELHLKAQVSPLLGDADGSQAEKRGFNPWGLHCHQAHLSRLCAEYPENQRHRILAHRVPRQPHKAGQGDTHRARGGMGGGKHRAGWGQGWG